MDGMDGSFSGRGDLDALDVLRQYNVKVVGGAPRQAVHVVVHPRLRLTFNGAPSTLQDVDLEGAIDTTGWLSGALLVRLLAKTSWPTGASVAVIARRVSIPTDAPSTVFSGGTMAFVEVLAAATAPRLYVAAFNLPVTKKAAITVRLNQPATAGAVSIELGIELVGRTAARGPRDALDVTLRPRSGIVAVSAPVPYREAWGARAISAIPANLAKGENNGT